MPTEDGTFGAGDLNAFASSEGPTEPEELLGTYFNSSTVGLGLVDSELRYLAVNRTLAEINGVPAPEHQGKTVREVLGSFADQLEPEFQRVLSTREPVHFELSGTVPSRTHISHWVAHYLPIVNASGAVTRIAVVVVEVKSKKKLEESLRDVGGKLHKEMDRLQMVLDVTNLLSSNWDVPKIFPMISARIRRVLRQELASFALRDVETGLLVGQAIDFPLSKGLVSTAQISSSNSPAGHSLEQGMPAIFSKEDLEGFDAEIAKDLLAEGIQSLCCVPLQRPKGPLGVFVLGSTRQNAFRDDDLDVMNQVAAQLALAIENHRAALEIDHLKERLSGKREYLEGETSAEAPFPEIVREGPALNSVLDQVATLATSEATVLILGETGTGKELIARAIHQLGRRKDKPFIKVNCAAIPTGLLESELFGHERGAFTGAISQRVGRMEMADTGTLFLDEVGEIPLELQPKLLRVLQDQEFERLGSNRTVKVSLRVLAATNRNLAESMSRHQFRSDLFYRLSVFPIQLPPLRERREDIPVLVRHFVRKFARRMDRYIENIPEETMKALSEWHWPGNVRELENLMERSVILSAGSVLHVPLSELQAQPGSVTGGSDDTLDSAERSHIIRVLRETGGVLSGTQGAARRLGLKRTTLQSKMQRLKITRQDYSGPQRS